MEAATIGQLHDALDWQLADDAQARLAATDSFYSADPDFLRRWRCTLLESALYSTVKERKASAIRMLQQAGVWTQVPLTLRKLGVIVDG